MAIGTFPPQAGQEVYGARLRDHNVVIGHRVSHRVHTSMFYERSWRLNRDDNSSTERYIPVQPSSSSVPIQSNTFTFPRVRLTLVTHIRIHRHQSWSLCFDFCGGCLAVDPTGM